MAQLATKRREIYSSYMIKHRSLYHVALQHSSTFTSGQKRDEELESALSSDGYCDDNYIYIHMGERKKKKKTLTFRT